MSSKEKYDELILSIENMACNPFTTASEIAALIIKESGFSLRDLNVIMAFMTDHSLLEYIKERKIMAACEYMLKNREKDMEEAIAISGLSDTSSFHRKFKKTFGITPGEALEKDCNTLLRPPEIWDNVAETEKEGKRKPQTKSEYAKKDTVFDISEEQYRTILEAHELSVLYDLDLILSDQAFQFAKKHKYPLNQSFRYFSEIVSYAEDLKINDDSINIMETVQLIAPCPDIQYLCFELNLPIHLAIKAGFRIRREHTDENPFNLRDLDPELILCFSEMNGMSFKYFKEQFDYYKEHTDNSYDDLNFEEYLQQICQNVPKEEALKNIVPAEEFDPFSEAKTSYNIEDPFYDFDYLERSAEEEEEWNHRDISWDYDEDNPDFHCF